MNRKQPHFKQPHHNNNKKIPNKNSNLNLAGVSNHRKYHRLSNFTPDQQKFISYLLQRGYDITLKVFQQEINQKNCNQINRQYVTWIEQIMRKGRNGQIGIVEFRNFIKRLKTVVGENYKQWVKIEFMLIVWFCSVEGKINSAKSKLLRQFIQKNGISLSQKTQLLPYFALPYVNEPQTHPFLSTIFQQQFQLTTKQLILSLNPKPINKIVLPHSQKQKQLPQQTTYGNINKNLKLKEQNEWLTIVKDLIQICLQFDNKITAEQNISNKNISNNYKKMIQRVKKYEKAISDIDGYKSNEDISVDVSQLSKLYYMEKKIEQIIVQNKQVSGRFDESIASISSVQAIQFQPIYYQSLKQFLNNSNLAHPRSHKQFCLTIHALTMRIKYASHLIRKQYINQYISNDLFGLRSLNGLPKILKAQKIKKMEQIESLKWMNMMCQYSCTQTRKYIEQYADYMQILCRIIRQNKLEDKKNDMNKKNGLNGQRIGQQNKNVQQKLLQAFGILQKISNRNSIICKIINIGLVDVLVNGYLVYYQILPGIVLTYVLALLLNIVLNQDGKLICCNIKIKGKNLQFFQLMTNIWEFISRNIKQKSKLLYLHQQTKSHQKRTVQAQQNLQQEYQIQSLVYSIFYVILSLQKNKRISRQTNFLQKLQTYLSEHRDQYHIKVITEILSVTNSKEQINMKKDQNQQEQSQSESDQDVLQQYQVQSQGYVWIGTKLTQLPTAESNIQQILIKYYASNQNKQPIQPLKKIHQNIIQNISTPILPTVAMKQKKQIYASYINPNVVQKNKNADNMKINQKHNKAGKVVGDNILMNAVDNKGENNRQQFQKFMGYDPSKYEAWKRLKTTKT